jgi:transposase-like protein
LVNCPKCKTSNIKPEKTWKYGQFSVQSFTCKNCNTKFREYTKDAQHAFTLKLEKGKGYIKA